MWIDVFKGGEQTDSAGNTHDWTSEELQAIVENYNNQEDGSEHRAPVVIGHPTDISPAYAWVKELKVEDDVLYADIIDVQPEFADWVDRGLYRERSIALDEELLFQHLGFLGGVPPAVKGLTPVRFNESQKTLRFFSLVTPAVDGTLAPTTVDPNNTIAMTVQQAIADQQARSAKYGIRVQEKGNVVKPPAFAELTDDQFADPVNYRWPIATLGLLCASKNTCNMWNDEYNETERILIQSRFIEVGIALGLEVKNWYFNSNHKAAKSWALAAGSHSFTIATKQMDPILTGLVDWLRTTYNEETAQQTQAQIDSLQQSMVTTLQEWVNTTFGADVGTAFAAKLAELNTAAADTSTTAAADPAATAAGATTAAAAPTTATGTQHSAEFKAMEVRLAELEYDKRRTNFSAFADKMISEGKLLPANRDGLIEQLELAHASDAAGSTQDSVKKTMGFMSNMPRVAPAGQFATPGTAATTHKSKHKVVATPGTAVDPESEKRREMVQAYADKHGLKYTQAFNKLKSEGAL